MSGFFDKIVSALFSMSSWYGSIRAHHHDDWFTAEFKELQRTVVASFVYLALAIIVPFVVSTVFTGAVNNAILGPAISTVTEPLGMLVLWVRGFLLLRLIFALVGLYLFIRKHGQD